MAVVDEAAPDHEPAVRRERPGEHVRALRVVATVGEGSGPVLGVRLHEEPAEVGDRRVDRLRPLSPVARDAGVERIGGIEPAYRDRARVVDAREDPDPIRSEDRRDPREIREIVAHDEPRLAQAGVHVVDRNRVDPDRGEHTRVVGQSRRIAHQSSVLEKDGPSGVATLDRPVRIVPVVEHPQLVRRRFADREPGRLRTGLHEPDEMKGCVEQSDAGSRREPYARGAGR